MALIKQSALLWQLGSCLFGVPAREFLVSHLSQLIGPWVVALLVTLSQRGCNSGLTSTDERTSPIPTTSCVDADHAGLRVSLLAVKASVSSGCQPGGPSRPTSLLGRNSPLTVGPHGDDFSSSELSAHQNGSLAESSRTCESRTRAHPSSNGSWRSLPALAESSRPLAPSSAVFRRNS